MNNLLINKILAILVIWPFVLYEKHNVIFRSSISNQANMFIDRRFGEYDEKMTLEDKMMKRFTMEKKVMIYRNIWLEY